MNGWVLAAAWASPVITLIGMAFIAGTLKQKVLDQDRRIEGHDERFSRNEQKHDDLGGRVGDVEVVVEGLKQWRDGYNAAAAVKR